MTVSTGICMRFAPLLLAATLVQCSRRDPASTPDPTTPAMLQVENRGFADMVVYAVSGSQRIRLGLANGNSTKSFTIPTSLIQGSRPLRFLADPVGGNRSPISEEMVVHPGDIVTLTIPP